MKMATDKQIGSVPIPDPTELTTQALRREIENLKELMLTKIAALDQSVENKIVSVNILKEEKFKELHERLAMVERHRIESKADDAQALSAALTSMKELLATKSQFTEEAAAKSEASFTKQIESIGKEGNIERRALSDRINSLEGRLDRGAGKETGQRESKEQQNWLIGAILGGIAVIVAVVSLFMHQSQPPVTIRDSGPTTVPTTQQGR